VRSRSSCTHPDIDDVQEIGVPDDKYSEEICAWIKMRSGCRPLDADAVRAFSSGNSRITRFPVMSTSSTRSR
jgi:fatty-acyl-CoA synthase